MTQTERIRHLTKENVLQAIARIQEEGVPSARESNTYDLVHEGIAYPPKYLTSLAGYFSEKGQFILASNFSGGEESVCFAKLRELGFEILSKEETKDLPKPKEADRKLHYKYCYRVIDEKLDEALLKEHFTNYLKHCRESTWLTIYESYKFRFGRWMTERVNIDTQSDEEILAICIASQEEMYEKDSTTKGINFIVSQKRYQDDFIALIDIQNIRRLHQGELLSDADMKKSPLSFPKFTTWAGLILPEDQMIFGSDELTNGIAHLFHLSSYPKTGVRAFNLANACLKEIKVALIRDYMDEVRDLIQLIFPNTSIQPVDLVWLVQDFILYLNRIVLSADKTSYWVFQGRPEIYDAVSAIKNEALETWSVHAHKSKIKVGDKIILWLTGAKSGCYALAEVTSELFHSEEISNERKYYATDPGDVTSDKVRIKITHDFTDTPFLKENLMKNPVFKNFKGGNQGTNFTATKEQYESLLNKTSNMDEKNYWVYSPGANAQYWETFYSEGILGLGWNELGDISRFNSKDQIVAELQRIEETDGSKKNDATANWDFVNRISIGDVIIAKRGRQELLGYGIVTSDYYYDPARTDQHHLRKIDWKIKGNWPIEYHLSLKTLTIITDYGCELPEFEFYYQRLLAAMEVDVPRIKKNSMPINQILYGPPGTGKTYHLKSELFPLYTTQETSLSKEKYFAEKVVDLTWWQVAALALMESNNVKVGDIQSNRWVSAKAAMSESKNVRATIWGTLQMHTIDESETVGYTQRQAPLIFNKNEDKTWTLLEQEAREQVPELYELLDEVNNFNPNPDKLIKRYTFCTFHQSYGYEDFIEGIKPIMSGEGEQVQLSYQIQEGVFKEICRRAENDPENRYAIFIDEINRGNVSSIFGELITLIESDKRLGMQNELRVSLPYSKKSFGVPSNVDIYGTMNTADRSVEALDTALRRRFSFVERMPDSSLLADKVVGTIQLKELLDIINERIEALIDRDHTIGHAYFINVEHMKDLRATFKDKIIPLLQEYFYGDYGKIGLVLGKGFVEMQTKEDSIFSSFEYEGRESLSQISYALMPFDDIDFEEALQQLFNKK